MVVKAGSAGGVVVLLGRQMPGGEWRLALTTVDHSAELLSEKVVSGAERPSLEWVDSWKEGLRLLDRYPWVRLHPMEVHPAFVERVRAGVEGRLSLIPDLRERERARERWARLVRMATD